MSTQSEVPVMGQDELEGQLLASERGHRAHRQLLTKRPNVYINDHEGISEQAVAGEGRRSGSVVFVTTTEKRNGEAAVLHSSWMLFIP